MVNDWYYFDSSVDTAENVVAGTDTTVNGGGGWGLGGLLSTSLLIHNRISFVLSEASHILCKFLRDMPGHEL